MKNKLFFSLILTILLVAVVVFSATFASVLFRDVSDRIDFDLNPEDLNRSDELELSPTLSPSLVNRGVSPIPTKNEYQKLKAFLYFEEVSSGNLNIVIENAGLEIDGFQLNINHKLDIVDYSINPIFDAVLITALTDQELTLSAGKLNNIAKFNLDRSRDGNGFVIGRLILKNSSNIINIKLSEIEGDNIIIDSQGDKIVEYKTSY